MNEEIKCPHCGSKNYQVVDDNFDFHDKIYTEICVCEECSNTFYVNYKLFNIDIIKD